MSAFPPIASFAWIAELERHTAAIRRELLDLDDGDFVDSPDSLTTVSDGYDERGWRAFDLFGGDVDLTANRARCPITSRACAAVPGMVRAGFSLFRPGTHLYPHHGEVQGVLRCHLPLVVPTGDLGLRAGGETRVWQPGRCLIFDDTFEHDAWNRGDGDRVVLLVTFRRDAATA
ncbi:MAG: aspartyl/asparaginyl beta-hydroxylase domain-containing protein [Planctomycetota bacterium]